MTFCTLNAKDALMKELKEIGDDDKSEFIKRKQAERETITAVSSGLIKLTR
jgi:hypothetical protein